MLPKQLSGVRDKLKRKASLTPEEEELLEELEALDKEPGVKKLSESERIWKHSIVGGPTGHCPCCGRK